MGASITEVAQGDGSLVRIISGVNLDDPRGLAANGADLWVSNEGNDTVTELSAAHGTLVRTLEGSVYGFKGPLGIAEDAGGRLWVTNASSNSVSEVEASTGAFIRSIQVANVANSIPTAVATDGTSVWVALEQSNTVTEIDGSTGSVTLSEAGSTYGFNAPTEIAANASTVWVGSGGVVTALDASTGALRYRKSDGQYPDEICFGLAVVGPYLWDLAWQDKPVLVETDGATGRVLRRIQGPADGLNAPLSIASGLGRIWVGNYGAHTITELNGSSGRLIAVIQLPRGALHPRELASDGRHLWLANTNSVSEMSEFTGKTIRIIKSTRLGDGDTDEIVGSSTDVFATGEVTKKITEISTASGAVVRIFHGAPSWWHRVLTANANGIWVITGSYALVEYSATSGAVRAMLDGAALGFDGPTAAAVSGGQVWVANYDGDSVTEIPAG